MVENRERCKIGYHQLGAQIVSTIFTGVNLSWFGLDLFETMVLDAEGRRIVERYETYEAALAGHEKWLSYTQARMIGTN